MIWPIRFSQTSPPKGATAQLFSHSFLCYSVRLSSLFTVKIIFIYLLTWASLVAQTIKNLPAMHETWVRPLGWEDPLEESMATHSNILTWRIPWTEELGGLQSIGSQRVLHDWRDLACMRIFHRGYPQTYSRVRPKTGIVCNASSLRTNSCFF